MLKNKNTDPPLITIGITCYNALHTIDAAIKSALRQDWPATEILVVDDASDDGSPAHIESSYGEQLRLLRNEKNKGVAASRNKIIERANGEFIVFFDDDDISQPERLRKQYEALMKSDMPLAFCHSARLQIYPDGTQRIEQTIDGHTGPALAQRILFGRPLKGHAIGSLATCSQMARTEAYKTLGGFDEQFRRGEDTDLAVRAALQHALFIGISEPLVEQTMTPTSEKNIDEEYKFWTSLYQKHKRFLEKHGQFDHANRWLALKRNFYERKKRRFYTSLAALFLSHPVLTARRLLWAAPNIGFNIVHRNFKNNH